jgi:hypothetical protein
MNLEDITIKKITEAEGYIGNNSIKEGYRQVIIFSLKKGKDELIIAIKNVEKAIELVEKKLASEGVQAAEIARA